MHATGGQPHREGHLDVLDLTVPIFAGPGAPVSAYLRPQLWRRGAQLTADVAVQMHDGIGLWLNGDGPP